MVINLNFSRILSIAFLAPYLISCAPSVNSHGFDKESINFSKISPGISNREEVQHALGSPTNISNFPPETWYYISKKTSRTAFMPVKTLEQSVVEVTFSSTGIVTNVRTISAGEGREIKPIKRQTPNADQNTSVWREIFSNFGRLAPKSSSRQ